MYKSSRAFLGLGALALLLATALAAYGTHALAARLPAEAWSAFTTAVDYQFYHGLGLCVVAALVDRCPTGALLHWSGALLCVGIALFCGGIYATTFGAPAAIGQVVPLGGVAFMAAWLLLGIRALVTRERGAANPLT